MVVIHPVFYDNLDEWKREQDEEVPVELNH